MRRPWCWMIALVVTFLSAHGAAQAPPDPVAKKSARALAEDGRKRFQVGDYAGAIKAFRAAEKYFTAPTILIARARAHEKLGQLLEARDVLQHVEREQLAANAPSEFWNAKKDAKAALVALETRIPRIEIALIRAPDGTRVTLDGKPLDSATLSQPLRLDPGKHTIVIEPPGGVKVLRELDLKESSLERVTVNLTPSTPTVPTAPETAPAPVAAAVPAVRPAAPVSTPGPRAAGPAEPMDGQSIVGPAIAFGTSGAGLLVGAITGGISLAKASEYRDLCGEKLLCPKGSQGKIGLDGAMAVAHVSTAAFAVAGVAAAAGALVLLLKPNKKEPTSTHLTVGPGFVSVRGAF